MEQSFEKQETPLVLSVGAQLKAARQTAGLSLGEVADRLKFSIRQLEAIEKNDFSILPGATFVRGFVRNYARFLNLDTEPLMKLLEQQFPSAVNDVVNLVRNHHDDYAGAAVAEPELTKGVSRRWVSLSLVLLLVVAGVIWLANSNHWLPSSTSVLGQVDASEPVTQQAAAVPAPTIAASAVVVDATVAVASAPVVSSSPLPVVAATVPSVPATSSQTASVPTVALIVPETSPNATGQVMLSLKDDASWVSLADATGKKLIYETLPAGTSKRVSGVLPFTLVIGNATQVSVSFNGKVVDISEKIHGTTARLHLE